MNNTQYLRQRLLQKAGLPLWDGDYAAITANVNAMTSQFFTLMKNRLIMGHMRYGPLGAPDKPHYDHLKAIKTRLAKWEQDGNDEHLVDIANLCLVELIEGTHPHKHFLSADGGGIDTKP